MAPVSMPGSEVYETLQISDQNTEFVVMNLETWNNLSEEQRRVILDARVAWISSQMQGEGIPSR